MNRTSTALALLAVAALFASGAQADPASRPRVDGRFRGPAPIATDTLCVALVVAAPEEEPAPSAALPSQTSRGPGPLAPQGAAPVPTAGERPTLLRMLRASWDLDVAATIATGILEVEFANDSAQPRVAALILAPPVSVTLEQVEAIVAGVPVDLSLASLADRPAPRTLRGRVHGTPSPDVRNSADIDLPPGGTVLVRIRLRVAATFAAGDFKLALPLVNPNCDLAASHQSPDLGVRVMVRHSGAFELAGEPSLPVATEEKEGGALLVLTNPARADVDRFSVAWRVGSEDGSAGDAWVSDVKDRRERHADEVRDVTLLLMAPRRAAEGSVRAKDVVFVVDTSGSMIGPKLVEARAAVNACIGALRKDDAFNVIEFDQKFVAFRGAPVLASPEEQAAAGAWIDALQAEGGTQLAAPLAAALSARREDAGHRLIVILSDGRLGDEREVMDLVRDQAGDARLLVVAIGSDANRETLTRLAGLGRGESVQVSDPTAIVSAMTTLLSAFGAPVAWDLAVDWGSARVISQHPERVPDLYTDRPVVLRARIEGELPEELLVRGVTTTGAEGYAVEIPLRRGR